MPSPSFPAETSSRGQARSLTSSWAPGCAAGEATHGAPSPTAAPTSTMTRSPTRTRPSAVRDAVAERPSGDREPGTSTIVDLLVGTGLCRGRSDARRTVADGGAYLNNEKVTDEDAPISGADLLAGGVVLVRRGRRNLAVARAK